MEGSGAAPLCLEVCHAPDPRGLLFAAYVSIALWAGLGLLVQALH